MRKYEQLDKAGASILLFSNLSEGKKILLLLKIFTTFMLSLTILSMLLYPPCSIYLWAVTFLLSNTTIIYAIHLWFSEEYLVEKNQEKANVVV